MASVTCGLTAEDRDQLQNQTLVPSIGLPLRLPVRRTGERVDNAPDCQSVESRRPQGDPVVHSATASDLLEHRQLQRCRRDHQRTQVSDRTL